MKQKMELPETLTIDAYKDWRRDGLLDSLAAVGAALLRSCFPVPIEDYYNEHS